MIDLCYVAIPQGWESPKGVIMRTALHNGYQTVAAMCAFLKIPCSGDGLNLLAEQSSLFSKLAIAAPEIAQPLSANTYTVENSDTALWIIDEIPLRRSQFSHHFTYCPKCLRDELITVFQDIHDLLICPLHGTKIVTYCPDCLQREHWTKANLLYCKCGSDRRHTNGQRGSLVKKERVETFGPNTYIFELSHIAACSQICEEIWNSRKPNGEQNSCLLLDVVRKHAAKMIKTQLARYPGFTRLMHLSPWASSHPLLALLADKIIEENSLPRANNCTGLCCANIELTMSEIMYSVGESYFPGWKNELKEKTLVTKNFQIGHNIKGTRYYHCYTPICKAISFAHDCKLHIESEIETIEFNYLSIPEAAKFLHCSSGTALQLAELGYLQKSDKSVILGSGHGALISKSSFKKFISKYILTGEISYLLKISPVKTARLLNKFGIASVHNKLGPCVYKRCIIDTVWEKLALAVTTPTSPSPLAWRSNRHVHKLETKDKIATEVIASNRPILVNEPETETNIGCYTLNQVSELLDVSCRLLFYRFILTGLIKPKLIEGQSFYSPAHVQAMSAHMQQNLTIEQITKILKCGYKKAASLINSSNLQPSCVLTSSKGDRQYLYNKKDIYLLRNHSEKIGALEKHKSR
jgi:hypothetical protein